MDLLQIATGITKCDDYYKLRQYTCSLPALRGPSINNQFDEQYPKAMIVNLICHPWWQLLMKWYTLEIREQFHLGSGYYWDLDKTRIKLFPDFTLHHLITHTYWPLPFGHYREISDQGLDVYITFKGNRKKFELSGVRVIEGKII